jgi:hypothetical protein
MTSPACGPRTWRSSRDRTRRVRLRLHRLQPRRERGMPALARTARQRALGPARPGAGGRHGCRAGAGVPGGLRRAAQPHPGLRRPAVRRARCHVLQNAVDDIGAWMTGRAHDRLCRQRAGPDREAGAEAAAGAGAQIAWINDAVGDPEMHAHLLEFDTVHGRWDARFAHDADSVTSTARACPSSARAICPPCRSTGWTW